MKASGRDQEEELLPEGIVCDATRCFGRERHDPGHVGRITGGMEESTSQRILAVEAAAGDRSCRLLHVL